MDESDLKMEEVDKDVKMETETAEGEGSSSETPKALKRRPKLHSKSRGSSKALKDPEGRSKVIKISHLPFGFFEEELFKYFKQFGYVRRVRVARSLKTGNCKGFAFVLFSNEDVAQVAAETMNGYIMFEKRLLCRVLKNKDVPRSILVGKTVRPKPIRGTAARKHARLENKAKDDKAVGESKKRLLKRLEKTKERLAKMGFEYSIEPTEFVEPSKPVVEKPKKEQPKEESLNDSNNSDVEQLDADGEIVRKVKKPRMETTTKKKKAPKKVKTSEKEKEVTAEREKLPRKVKKSVVEEGTTVKKAKITKEVKKSAQEISTEKENVSKKLKKSEKKAPAEEEDIPKKVKKLEKEMVKAKKVAKEVMKRKGDSVPKKAKLPKRQKLSTKQPFKAGKGLKRSKIQMKKSK